MTTNLSPIRYVDPGHTLSADQERALDAIRAWWVARLMSPRNYQQLFRLFGYAGTGKSSLLPIIVAALKLDPAKVVYAAFTGKAALVMRRNGLPATTIHSLCYVMKPVDEIALLYAKDKLERLLAKGGPHFKQTQREYNSDVWIARKRVQELARPQFSLNSNSPIKESSLVILDECSMCSDQIMDDILSFNVPVLILGDPFQLPPVRGCGSFMNSEPDAMLTEIHRQAKDNPIIQLSMRIREGGDIPYGKWSSNVVKVRGAPPVAALLRADQVICGLNKTRIAVNNLMKAAAGFAHSDYPTGGTEKIIILRNDAEAGLINGQFATFTDIARDPETHDLIARIVTEDGLDAGVRRVWTEKFDDHIGESRHETYSRPNPELVHATWGWCITCHKSQGSQWGKVAYIEEPFGATHEERQKARYTAVTRAIDSLLVIG